MSFSGKRRLCSEAMNKTDKSPHQTCVGFAYTAQGRETNISKRIRRGGVSPPAGRETRLLRCRLQHIFNKYP